MIYLGCILLVVYIIILMVLLFGYQKVKEFQLKKTDPTIHFSIIISFRNEAENLPDLLKSIEKLNYPSSLFEVIFVDDESSDTSVELIKNESNFNNYSILKNNRKSSSPKKDAITEAIKSSKHEWIITTDADCILPENWLLSFNEFIKKNKPDMVVGSVNYIRNKSVINAYQQLDNFSLQTVTIGAFGFNYPLISNGANLAYRKDLFKAVSGFSGNDSVASGDDIFLMEKFKSRNNNGVQFLKSKNSIVMTSAENTWKKIINQRVRWASKTSKQKNIVSQFIGLNVFLINLFIIIGFIVSFFSSYFLQFYLGFLLLKVSIDFIFIFSISHSLKYRLSLISFIFSNLMYPIITVLVVLNTFSGSYQWKGRSFRK